MEIVEVDAGHEGIAAAELRPLLVRRDGPGLVRIGVQLALLATSAALVLTVDAAWPFAVIVMGVLVATLFPAMHEAGHGTAFASKRLCEAVTWVGGIAMIHAPALFREFHFAHHRHTQDPAQDPEIAGAPQLLDDWPKNPLHYVVVSCGQLLLIGKIMFALGAAFAPPAVAAKAFPYVRPAKRARVAWESRIMVAVIVATLVLGFAYVPHFGRLLVAWPIAHLVLGIYLLAEHTGLPHDGSQQHRTRSVTSNAVVRWFMWNMPLHAVHHMHPAIPFFAVPAAHRLVAPSLEHVASGYLAVHREAIAHALGRRAPPS